MVHKIVAGAFAALMAGALVYGAVALARGEEGHGPLALNAQAERGAVVTTAAGGGRGAGGVGWGQQIAPRGKDDRAPSIEALPHDWETLEGVVTAVNELVIALDEGATVQVGLGPEDYREAAGFEIEIGQRLVISGYEEDNEFKAGVVTNLATGQSITLRSESGRPMWSGQGQGKNRR